VARSSGWPVLVVLVAMAGSARKSCAQKLAVVEENARVVGLLVLLNAYNRGRLKMGHMHSWVSAVDTELRGSGMKTLLPPWSSLTHEPPIFLWPVLEFGEALE
jgi:hypothetical protein